MSTPTPPSLPTIQGSKANKKIPQWLLWLAVFATVIVLSLLSVLPIGLVRSFRVANAGMAPTLVKGDHLLMEKGTFLTRKPRRGDVIVFNTDGIALVPAGSTFVMRVAGEPGEHLRISEGKIFADDKPVPLCNAAGEITYCFLPETHYLTSASDVVTVPENHYFVLGDNSGNSWDSRSWGFVPAENIKGRASFRNWPTGRMGTIK